MSTSDVKLQDMSDSESGDKKKPTGCHVSVIHGFILTFLAMTIAAIVGIIVHFAGRGGTECICNFPEPTPMDANLQWLQCQDLSAKKNVCLSAPHCYHGVPATTTPGPVSTTPMPLNSTTTAPSLPTDVRLPLAVRPEHYELTLKPDIYTGNNETFTFSGDVTITVKCLKATNVITMHTNKLVIGDTITVTGVGVNAPAFDKKEIDESRQFLKIYLNGMLMVNQKYTVHITFNGPLKPDLVGLYWSSYAASGGTKKYLATTQMQPTDARKTFPCFDEPEVKATFGVTLWRKSNMKSLSNMNIVQNITHNDGWVSDVYAPTVKMSTYLLAFIICDFEYTEQKTKSGVLFRVWSRPEALSQTEYALDSGVRTLEFFEDYFNISFPLPKQDMIAVPDFAAGAMENWGLIIYRETALLYDVMLSSAANKQRVAEVVVHELAHQWFGNLVTPNWWDDLWLNEGFASYMEYVGMEEIEPTWNIKDQFVEQDLHSVFQTDSLSTSHPIYVPVNHPDEINEIFDSISYLKGASIIRMMNFFLGEKTFTTGLSNYLKKYAYAGSNHTDLWQALGKQAMDDGLSIDVAMVMNTWVQQMGYPLVTMEKSGVQVTVKQQYFRTDPNSTVSDKYTSPFGYKWEIPITIVDSDSPPAAWMDTTTLTWMNKNMDTMTLSVSSSTSWIVGNVGQFGYYRVKYDDHNWHLLTEQLKNDHKVIPVKNRAQIIDDAITIGRSGYMDELIGLKTTEYLSKEEHYVPWKTAADAMSYYSRMLRYTEYFGDYKKYMLKLTTAHYVSMGLDYNQTTEEHLSKYKRSLFATLTCAFGYQRCLDDVSALYKQWMMNPNDSALIKPDLKTTVYCSAINNGGVDEWNFLYAQYKTSNVAAEQARILYAITCSSEPWILNRLLKYTLDKNEIRRQDALYVIRDISLNPIGREIAWNFFRSHWLEIKEVWGSGFFQISNTITGITSTFNTQFDLDQLLQFKQQNPDLGSGQRAYEQAVEATKTNMKWLNNNGAKIGQWLKDNNA